MNKFRFWGGERLCSTFLSTTYFYYRVNWNKNWNVAESLTILFAWYFEIENSFVRKIADCKNCIIIQKALENGFITCWFPGSIWMFDNRSHVKIPLGIMNEWLVLSNTFRIVLPFDATEKKNGKNIATLRQINLETRSIICRLFSSIQISKYVWLNEVKPFDSYLKYFLRMVS